ncbi:putative type II DNA modification enzyme [Candidatus Moduliflexus flocculans]|uniref:site-specific DNA-methyltransferase (adenine-specific) n=1 Tax=Candidatus Moduliflexus flocculans TaxID=1499966 RepID=A0A081BNX0_9BACT|nr:putative type II DNA modification enzyme [Candidatus Moduliflexus flocculans]
MLDVGCLADETIAEVREKEGRYAAFVRSTPYEFGRLWADAFCAAFVWRKQAGALPPITEIVFRNIERTPYSVSPPIKEEIRRLAAQYQFFHWHLAFPDVFRVPANGSDPEQEAMGWNGGFDVVLGNPPWERVKLQEKEWFAPRHAEIANAPNAAKRRSMIEALAHDDPALYQAFQDARRAAEGESHFIRSAGRYPLCGRGDVNTYTIFAELNRQIQHAAGRVGCIVPSGIATDDTTKFFFQDLMEAQALISLYDFENREGIFPAVHRSFKFCLLTLTGADRPARQGAEFVFFAQNTAELRNQERRFTLSAAEIALLNPNTRTCPIFRSKRDAELTKAIYQRVPILLKEGETEENPWRIRFLRMFDISNDSHLFQTCEQLETAGWNLKGNSFIRENESYFPLYEAKMVHQFNHRFASVEVDTSRQFRQGQPKESSLDNLKDPYFSAEPHYWVKEADVKGQLPEQFHTNWLIGFERITATTNERTFISCILPAAGHSDSIFLVLISKLIDNTPILVSNMNAFCFDYVTRQKLGGLNLNFFLVRQLPILEPSFYNQACNWYPCSKLQDWLIPRVLELTYTAWDLEAFAKDCGYDGPPFRWDEERRFLLRCELDAAYFHLYGIARDDAAYILDTFPIVKRKDEAKYGEYRTKREILDIYDAMRHAQHANIPYHTRLDPPPADPRVAHPAIPRP